MCMISMEDKPLQLAISAEPSLNLCVSTTFVSLWFRSTNPAHKHNVWQGSNCLPNGTGGIGCPIFTAIQHSALPQPEQDGAFDLSTPYSGAVYRCVHTLNAYFIREPCESITMEKTSQEVLLYHRCTPTVLL